jgi:hypothetical protein
MKQIAKPMYLPAIEILEDYDEIVIVEGRTDPFAGVLDEGISSSGRGANGGSFLC